LIGYFALIDKSRVECYPGYTDLRAKIKKTLDSSQWAENPCGQIHCDYQYANVLAFPDGTYRIIDWEYTAKGDPFIDIAFYALYAGMDEKNTLALLLKYLDRTPTAAETNRYYIALATRAFFETTWALIKKSVGIDYTDYGTRMLDAAQKYFKEIKEEK